MSDEGLSEKAREKDEENRLKNRETAEKYYTEKYSEYLKVGDIASDDIDLNRLVSHLSNSLTDQLYRGYLPPMEEKFVENLQDEGQKGREIENDLNVGAIALNVKDQLEKNLSRKIAEKMESRILEEMEGQYQAENAVEESMDFLVANMRWVFSPMFLAAVVVIIVLLLMQLIEIWAMLGSLKVLLDDLIANPTFLGIKSQQNTVVASILAILDLYLLGSLVIMVVVGGYENTISRIGTSHNTPTWFGKLNISQLKTKVAASIVIISSIHLLTAFMQLDPSAIGDSYNTNALMWTTIVHIVFVLAALSLAYMDKLSNHEN